jgi:hypothetical protein
MYAKLVVGGANISAYRAMRDIGRLLVSATPSVSLLEAFSPTSSVVVDNTPSGWTYVGSNFAGDQPTIAAAGAAINTTNGVFPNLAFSAPCLDGTTKYAVLSANHFVATAATYGVLTGAQSVSALGVCVNEGARSYTTSTADTQNERDPHSLRIGIAGVTIHVIANPRHVTLIEEGRGVMGVWEMSSTSLNSFYNTAPFVQYSHANTANFGIAGIVVPTGISTASTNSIMHTCFAITNPNTGTTYGTYDPTQGSGGIAYANIGYFAQVVANAMQNGINETGLPQYNVLPVILSNDRHGYPTQYISGVTPVYFCRAGIGASGDSVDVNGDTYYYFNSGTGFGLLMKLD